MKGCAHRLCPVCLDAEVRRLTTLLEGERTRCAQLEQYIRRLEAEARERRPPGDLSAIKK